jgi:hypothetical protein
MTRLRFLRSQAAEHRIIHSYAIEVVPSIAVDNVVDALDEPRLPAIERKD